MNSHDLSKKSAWLQQIARVREDFFARGLTVAEWSREHGFPPNAVYRVLSGHSLAMRGNAHKIAVALGVKVVPSNQEQATPTQEKETYM